LTRSALGERLLAVIQPVLFAWATVFAMATDVVSTPAALVRPLLVSALIALAIFGLLLIVARSWMLAALFASGLVLFSVRQPAVGLALIALAVWWLLVVFLRRRGGRPQPRPDVLRFAVRASGFFSIALMAVTGWTLYSDVSAGNAAWDAPSYTATGSGGPNVYVLLADGYPRSDTLAETFDIDNGEFLADLESLGFVVSDGARANYNKTWLTLASMLNGTYIDRVLTDDVPADGSIQIRWLAEVIHGAAMFDPFRDRGYVIRSVPSPFTSTSLTSVDDLIDIGGMTELEVRLISASPWAQVFRDPTLAFLRTEQSDVVRAALDTTAALAEESGTDPQLVITHVHSPHTPFVLHPEGTEPFPAPACQPTFCPFWNATIQELDIEFDEFRDGLEVQITELNRLILASVERIIDADPDALVILMSDHGIRYSLDDLDEHYRILLAARTPDGSALFLDDESPVNVLRGVLGHLGEPMDPLDYELWESDWFRVLDMERAE
jgi:hypothetical protein